MNGYQPGGYIRTRCRQRVVRFPSGAVFDIFAGCEHWCDAKPHGTIYYPEATLLAYANARLVPYGRLPRPFPGRLPGSRRCGAAGGEALPPTATDDAPRAAVAWSAGLQLCDPATAARFLRIQPECLRGWRRRGIGPAYVRLPGGLIRYPIGELVVFSALLRLQRERLPRQPRAWHPVA